MCSFSISQTLLKISIAQQNASEDQFKGGNAVVKASRLIPMALPLKQDTMLISHVQIAQKNHNFASHC